MVVGVVGGGDTVSFQHFLSVVDVSELRGSWRCDRCSTLFDRRAGVVGPYGLERLPAEVLCRTCVEVVRKRDGPLKVADELADLGVEVKSLGGGGGGR